MLLTSDTIIKAAAVLGAVLALGGTAYYYYTSYISGVAAPVCFRIGG